MGCVEVVWNNNLGARLETEVAEENTWRNTAKFVSAMSVSSFSETAGTLCNYTVKLVLAPTLEKSEIAILTHIDTIHLVL
jgi:hypothetical protein